MNPIAAPRNLVKMLFVVCATVGFILPKTSTAETKIELIVDVAKHQPVVQAKIVDIVVERLRERLSETKLHGASVERIGTNQVKFSALHIKDDVSLRTMLTAPGVFEIKELATDDLAAVAKELGDDVSYARSGGTPTLCTDTRQRLDAVTKRVTMVDRSWVQTRDGDRWCAFLAKFVWASNVDVTESNLREDARKTPLLDIVLSQKARTRLSNVVKLDSRKLVISVDGDLVGMIVARDLSNRALTIKAPTWNSDPEASRRWLRVVQGLVAARLPVNLIIFEGR